MSKLELHKAQDFCGSGKPRMVVVMLHGIASDASVYDGLLKHLEKQDAMQDVRFVTFDLLGAGKSPRGEIDYGFGGQLEALDNAIAALAAEAPLVLLGHSMGTLIATRYASKHPETVRGLVLVSPPIYRPEDFENPLFARGLEDFRKAISLKNKAFVHDKGFNDEMELIIKDRDCYEILCGIEQPTRIIYGELDQIIAPFNIPGVLKRNSAIKAAKTAGRHGVTPDKYDEVVAALKEMLERETI